MSLNNSRKLHDCIVGHVRVQNTALTDQSGLYYIECPCLFGLQVLPHYEAPSQRHWVFLWQPGCCRECTSQKLIIKKNDMTCMWTNPSSIWKCFIHCIWYIPGWFPLKSVGKAATMRLCVRLNDWFVQLLSVMGFQNGEENKHIASKSQQHAMRTSMSSKPNGWTFSFQEEVSKQRRKSLSLC